jgi:high-affinity nickel-transport protein
MLPIGVIFGLSLDSRRALLEGTIETVEKLHVSSGYVFMLAWLASSGMCLADTIQGSALLGLYRRARSGSDPYRILYYSILLSFLTVLLGSLVAILNILTFVYEFPPIETRGSFWDKIDRVVNHYEYVGTSQTQA